MDRKYLQALLGTNYDPNTFNCWHLVTKVQTEMFGRDLPTFAFVGPRERDRVFAEHPERARWTEHESPKDGDIALMGRGKVGDIHAGVFLAEAGPGGAVLHADRPHGVVLEDLATLRHAKHWQVTFYRPKE